MSIRVIENCSKSTEMEKFAPDLVVSRSICMVVRSVLESPNTSIFANVQGMSKLIRHGFWIRIATNYDCVLKCGLSRLAKSGEIPSFMGEQLLTVRWSRDLLVMTSVRLN